jgi:hypothetical protein
MKVFHVLGLLALLWSVASPTPLSSDAEDTEFHAKDWNDRDSSEERGRCSRGSIFDDRSQTCVSCPSGSIQAVSHCYCPVSLVRDYNSNACRACPANSFRRDGECECASPSLFFSERDWACKGCPGTLIPPRRGHRRYTCRCTGANQIFYEKNAVCYTCPTGTRADRDNDECDCAPNTDLEFEYKTGRCICEYGHTRNAFGVCTRRI